MRIQTIRRETGDMKPGQELHAAGSREPGNHYQKAPWNPVARGGQPGSEKGLPRPWPEGGAGGGLPAIGQLATPDAPQLGSDSRG